MPRERLSTLAVLPEDVTEPLLWRLALDVAAAHQPDEHGNCRNLQCAGQRGMCFAARAARRSMTLARTRRPPAVTPEPKRAHERAVARVPFRGWFATSPVQRVAAPQPGWLFGRVLAASAA